MKNLFNLYFLLFISSSTVIFSSSCTKEDAKPLTVSNESENFFKIGDTKNNIISKSYIISGDSTAYIVNCLYKNANDTSFLLLKGYGSEGIGKPMTTGKYKIVSFCDNCTIDLKPFEMILTYFSNQGGGYGTSGSVDVVVNNGKPTLTFENITLSNTDKKGSGKIIVQ